MLRTLPLSQSGSVFHPGEKYVQKKALERQEFLEMDNMGRAILRPFMPEQHRQFFSELSHIAVATKDQDGQPWASMLVGPVGSFISSPDPHHMVISTQPAFGDPVRLEVGSKVSMVGIMWESARRNRMNGTVTEIDPSTGSIIIQVDVSFGNCPRYITGRKLVLDSGELARMASARPQVREQGKLGPAQIKLIKGSDTFFLASAYKRAQDATDEEPAYWDGCDVNIRGGPTGFVQVSEDGMSLTWPDYNGNRMFQSLGNLASNPRAGLIFIDFASGTTLQLTGETTINWDDTSMPGSERSIHVAIKDWRWTENALPLRRVGKEFPSPYNPISADSMTNITREEVECLSVKEAAVGIKTYEFKMPIVDGKPLAYLAGQYASFDFQTQNGKVLNRTWTISSHPSESSSTFKISVKKAGVVSSWLHTNLEAGMELTFRGIGGSFHLPPPGHTSGPALLLAGGIGITPIRSIFLDLLKRGQSVVLVYSVSHSNEAAFLEELRAAAEKHNQRLQAEPGSVKGPAQIIATVTGPKDIDWAGLRGRVSADFLATNVPDLAQRKKAFMCGPDNFMAAVSAALTELKFPAKQLFQESFDF